MKKVDTIKVALISRKTLYTSPGGDTIQIDSTAKFLRRLGVIAEVKLTDEVIEYDKYDLLHFFNIIRPADIVFHIRKTSKPFVVSTIFVDYSEYEKKARRGALRVLSYLFSADQLEYFKAIARAIKNREEIKGSFYLLRGQKASIQYILKKCSCVLPNSKNEYKRLVKSYQQKPPCVVVPNALDPEIFLMPQKQQEASKKRVISVARLEGRKNQLNLIRALNGTDIELLIIGKPTPNNMKYFNQCKDEASSNVSFIDHLPQDEVRALYLSAKVHALPSWFETTGLVTLEAAAMGCNIVITNKGDQYEYFKDFAFYCEPDDINSIKNAVIKALDTPVNPEFSDYVRNNFTWDKTAASTYESYVKVLENCGCK